MHVQWSLIPESKRHRQHNKDTIHHHITAEGTYQQTDGPLQKLTSSYLDVLYSLDTVGSRFVLIKY